MIDPPPKASDERMSARFAWALGAIALLAFTLCLVLGARAPDPPYLTDPTFYRLQGILIAEGHGFADPFVWVGEHRLIPTAFHPPLYSVLLAAVSRLGLRSVGVVRIAVAVIPAGTAVMIALLGRRVGGERVGLVAGFAAAVYPNLLAPSAGLFSEGLAALLVAALLWSAYRLHSVPSPGRAITAGVLLGLAGLTRPETLLLGPAVLVPFVFVRGRPRRSALIAVALAALAACATLAPWSAWTLTRFHRPVLISSNGQAVIGVANCDLTFAGRRLGSWSADCPSHNERSGIPQRLPVGADESDVAASMSEQGTTYVRRHLDRFVTTVAWARIARTWSLLHPFDRQSALNNEGKTRLELYSGVVALWGLLALVAVGFVLKRPPRDPPWWPLLVPAVVATVVSVAAYGTPRFRVIAEPGIVVLAALGLDAGLTVWRSRWPRRAVASQV
jgi:4-amino-4-deoxy-L-arabinose transferase-like glycosyltransferase